MLKMKTKISRYAWGPTLVLLTILFGCSPTPQPPASREDTSIREEIKGGPVGASSDQNDTSLSSQLPVRFQTPSYTITDSKEISNLAGSDGEFTVKVGADISSTSGPVVLRDIIKKLVALKGMNVSWASDVDQYATVDVDIRADDDFFKAINQLLRQKEYSHEIQGNTIVVKYKDTRKFHLAMPFTTLNYSSEVGGDLLGTNKIKDINNINGNMKISSELNGDNKNSDVWNEIKLNLDKILNIWSQRTSQEQTGEKGGDKTGTSVTDDTMDSVTKTKMKEDITKEKSKDLSLSAVSVGANNPVAVGFYTIDKPVGLITVTAPSYQLDKIEDYITNLKKELYRQISIEAKILEVTITGEERLGIDWEDLLNNAAAGFDFDMQFGSSSFNQPFGETGSRSFKIQAKSFRLILDAIKKQGSTRVLANPKISVMNGQPAMISVGQNAAYIDSITSTISDTGIITWTAKSGRVMSGLALSVIANMMENDEVVLQLTPVTSQLRSLTYELIGTSGGKLGLPVLDVREMTTMVRVKDNELLVIGGLVDQSDETDNQEVPLLGRLPIIKGFFSHDAKTKTHKELVILLKTQVIS
ncbi:MAG: type II and III secretion system protein [Desulfobulbaceae bacterium]|nr:type II and III secretion system protein [Desulfobulbaceae bacterium]